MVYYLVLITLKVDYDEKDTARRLGCYWSMDSKTWQREFNSRFFKGNLPYFKATIHKFLKNCQEQGFWVSSIQGLDELEDGIEEFEEQILIISESE